MGEEWRDVPGYEGFYQVSSLGNIRSVERTDSMGRVWYSRIMKQQKDGYGYLRVELNRDGKSKGWLCHRIVALAFHGQPPTDYTVNHKNGNKQDNRPDNLEYMSRVENDRHSRDVLGNNQRGEDNGKARITSRDVETIRAMRRQKTPDGKHEFTLREIGESFGLCVSAIHAITCGINWSYFGESESLVMPKSRRRLTFDDAQDIRSLHAAGNTSMKALARQYGVNTCTVFNIIHNKIKRCSI